MGLDGVRPLGESYEAAVQVHEQCQEAAGEVCSPKKNWVEGHGGRCGVLSSKDTVPQHQSNANFIQEPRAQTVGQR